MCKKKCIFLSPNRIDFSSLKETASNKKTNYEIKKLRNFVSNKKSARSKEKNANEFENEKRGCHWRKLVNLGQDSPTFKTLMTNNFPKAPLDERFKAKVTVDRSSLQIMRVDARTTPSLILGSASLGFIMSFSEL